jgi:hypothetical protein
MILAETIVMSAFLSASTYSFVSRLFEAVKSEFSVERQMAESESATVASWHAESDNHIFFHCGNLPYGRPM